MGQAGQPKEKPGPLADRVRPKEWSEFIFGENSRVLAFREKFKAEGVVPSTVFFGPPGVGKTTLARLVGKDYSQGQFFEVSAASSGISVIKDIVKQLEKEKDTLFRSLGTPLIFVDEIHRFNKNQQDVLLPLVESGKIILLGATTEIPSFSLTRALNSRIKTIRLEPHNHESLTRIVRRVADSLGAETEDGAVDELVSFIPGDARQLLNLVEEIGFPLTVSKVRQGVAAFTPVVVSDKDLLYQLTSALIKSLRGSDADAALFWGLKMLETGADPQYLLRRLMIFASEDVGNADPRALILANSTAAAFERIGFPEGKIPLAQLITYLAGAPKSNRSYRALRKVEESIKLSGDCPVPMHLRNAAYREAKEQGAGQNYVYPHDLPDAYVKGESYLPENVVGRPFYSPSERGYELRMKERWQWLAGKEES